MAKRDKDEARPAATPEILVNTPWEDTLEARAEVQAVCIAFPERMSATQCASSENVSPSLGALNPTAVATQWAVRRLTPLECERLMGFPDGHGDIPYRGKPASECPDKPRYESLGNSWAINCARWIGERIEAVETIVAEQAELEIA